MEKHGGPCVGLQKHSGGGQRAEPAAQAQQLLNFRTQYLRNGQKNPGFEYLWLAGIVHDLK